MQEHAEMQAAIPPMFIWSGIGIICYYAIDE